MKKGLLYSGFAFWIIGAIFGSYLLWSKRAPLRFGIDLVGGTYITLDVKTEKAIESDLAERVQLLTKSFKQNNITEPTVKIDPYDKVTLTFSSLADAQAAQAIIKAVTPELNREPSGTTYILSYPENLEERIKKGAVASVRDVLEKRLNKTGVSEVLVATKGERHIIIELPDVQDPEKAKAMIGTPAMLEFKIVEKSASSEEALLEETDGEIPEGMVITPGKIEGGTSGTRRMYYLLPAYTDLTGRLLLNSSAGFGGGANANEPVVNFEFSAAGAERFGELTSQNYGRSLAFIVDDEVISAPRISDPIYGGRGYIHGSFTWESAQELATMLKTGSFVAPVAVIEERAVRPTLGEESIRQGLISCAVGLSLLLVFPLQMYREDFRFASTSFLLNCHFFFSSLSPFIFLFF